VRCALCVVRPGRGRRRCYLPRDRFHREYLLIAGGARRRSADEADNANEIVRLGRQPLYQSVESTFRGLCQSCRVGIELDTRLHGVLLVIEFVHGFTDGFVRGSCDPDKDETEDGARVDGRAVGCCSLGRQPAVSRCRSKGHLGWGRIPRTCHR